MTLNLFRRLDRYDRRIRQLERTEPPEGGGGGGGDHLDSDHADAFSALGHAHAGVYAPVEHDTTHDDRFALIAHTHAVHADSDHDDRFSQLTHVHVVAWGDITGKPSTFTPTPETLLIEELADVNFATGAPADGYVLVYNGVANKWRAASLTGEGTGVFHPYLGDPELELRASFVETAQVLAAQVYTDGGGGNALMQIGDHAAAGNPEPRLDFRRFRANDARISVTDTVNPGVDWSAKVNVQAGSLQLNGTPVALTPGAWQTVTTFGSGWGAHASDQAPRYRLEGDIVRLDGSATRTSGTNTTIFTLPSGYRPSNIRRFWPAGGATASVRIAVQSSGTVDQTAGADFSRTSLEGCMFPIT